LAAGAPKRGQKCIPLLPDLGIGWQGRDVHRALCVGNRAFVERSNAHGQSIDKGVEFREAERGPFQSARSVLADVQPGQALLWKYVPGRLKLIGLIKCTDMEMGFVGQADGFAGQGRPTPGTKASRRSSRRRIELGYLTFGDRILGMLKRYEDPKRVPHYASDSFGNGTNTPPSVHR
jgi:hypothetical protein